MNQYKLISRKGEGTFSEVLKAQNIQSSNYVAIKCMKTHFTSIEQVNQLREIQALRKVSPHPNIIKLLEVLYDEPTGRLALVFELMEMNLYELIKDRKTYLSQSKVKYYMYQVFKAIDQMHKKGIFHRDIKPENILVLGDLVKLADLGSCRGMYGKHPYTEYISTRWYRSPECLMTDGYYDEKMDIWGAGCVMFEILTLVPLFPGKNELDMVHRIHNILGTPSQRVLDRFKSHASHLEFNFPEQVGSGLEKLLTHVSSDCLDLLKQVLIYDPEKRISAEQVLQHDYFREIVYTERQKELRTTLSSVVSSPHSKQFQQSLYLDREKSSIFSNEKPPQHSIVKKKNVSLKKTESNGSSQKIPSLKLSMKVEGGFKLPYTNNTSTEEEYEERTGMLPPLKQSSIIQFDGYSNAKKKDNSKGLSHMLLKSHISHQHLYKKPKKNSMFQNPEYLVVGKKAG